MNPLTDQPFNALEILRLHAFTRDYQTRIERLLTVAIARRAAASTNGLTGRVDVITSEVPLEALIRAWMGFPADIGDTDVRRGLMLLQRREVLTITEGRPTVLIITPSSLDVDPLDTRCVPEPLGHPYLREEPEAA